MAKLIFLEGISGVGKSTMARSLCEDLQAKGLAAKAYLEFDYTNPIDFYCVAYYAAKEYEMLLTDNPENEASISSNTINAGKARLIHCSHSYTLVLFIFSHKCYVGFNTVAYLTLTIKASIKKHQAADFA